jgi:hypothetical protein
VPIKVLSHVLPDCGPLSPGPVQPGLSAVHLLQMDAQAQARGLKDPVLGTLSHTTPCFLGAGKAGGVVRWSALMEDFMEDELNSGSASPVCELGTPIHRGFLLCEMDAGQTVGFGSTLF